MIRFDEALELNSDPVPTWDGDFPFKVSMLFPYWSSIDRLYSFCSSSDDCLFNYANRSAVFYQVYTEGSNAPNASDILDRASQDVKNNTQSFNSFSATWVLVVTWLRLRPEVESEEDVEEDTVSPIKIQQTSGFLGKRWGLGRVFFYSFDTVRSIFSTKYRAKTKLLRDIL